ncbi:protein starmaker [Nilaparvata lugens]|uniref:protein starmaker n=1 Tax=Nilaparvata lugens TaxID=108931 RepID=UPI00193CF288|nr:protein starmaker [Nilaparvata lugens]XP_039283454.1 protein starmaker [Nilaparvata lugens]
MSLPKQTRKDSKEVDDFDISILKTLPRQLIGEAVSYIKNKKHLEELEAIRKKKEEEEKLSKVKCIPPWAKTLAGERKPDERKDVATQYEVYCEGREGERGKEESGKNEDFPDSDIGEGEFDKEMREWSEEEGELRGMEGDEMGEEGSFDLVYENGEIVGRTRKVKGYNEALGKGDGSGEDIHGKIGSKEEGIDGEEDKDLVKTKSKSGSKDGSKSGLTDDDEDHRKASVSFSKDGEGIDDEHRKKKFGEEEDDHDGESLLSQERAKDLSESDYEKAHTEYSSDSLKAGGISSEFTEGGEAGGSIELQGKGEGEMEAAGEQDEVEDTTEKTVEERMGNDSRYLQKHFGNYLVKSLAEIAWKRPADPIHYLAHRLYHFRHIEEMTVKNSCEEKQIQEARKLYAMEMKEQIDDVEETENVAEDEELEEAEIVTENVQEFEDVFDSTSGDDISQIMLNVEPEERLSPAELGF